MEKPVSREKNEADTQKDPAMRDGGQLSWCACTEAFPRTLDFRAETRKIPGKPG